MKNALLPVLLIVASAVLNAASSAQQSRYELGLRVRAFEEAFAPKMTDLGLRRRVVPKLQAAVQGFFTANPGGVARAMDEARRIVEGIDDVDDARRFVDAIECRLSSRCIDPAGDEQGRPATVELAMRSFYRARALHEKLEVACSLVSSAGRRIEPEIKSRVEALPLRLSIPLPAGIEDDYALHVVWHVGERKVAHRTMTVSAVANLADRMRALREYTRAKKATAQKVGTQTVESATLAEYARTLRVLALRRTLETDVRACALMRRAEALRAWSQSDALTRGPWFDVERRGDSTVAFPFDRGNVRTRLFVPELPAQETDESVAKEAPRPLVIALAGAGGSANMWFEAYGAGAIVDHCRERGWICVARASSGVDPVRSVVPMIDAIAARWPVDRRRVFLVGHSMGAMKACATAAEHPESFRAVVALGGGGVVGRGDAYRRLSFFVAPGDQDFLRGQARSLARALEVVDPADSSYRVYEACEHLGIVQVALPDVFEWLDGLARR